MIAMHTQIRAMVESGRDGAATVGIFVVVVIVVVVVVVVDVVGMS